MNLFIKSRSRIIFTALAASCLAIVGVNAHALGADGEPSGLLLSGFGTVGLSQANTNFGGSFVRDMSQLPGYKGLQLKPDSALGVQANWAINNSFELVGQVVARDRPTYAPASDSVEWAFLAYRPWPDTKLRVGRVSANHYLQSDVRNVGFTYPTVRPSVDFYGLVSVSRLDGADLTHGWRMGEADWLIKATVGSSDVDNSGQRTRLGNVRGFVLTREQGGLKLLGTVAKGRLKMNIPELTALQQGLTAAAQLPVPSVAAQAADMASVLDFQDIAVRYSAVGVAYDKNNWWLNAEWSRVSTGRNPLDITAAYALAGYRFGAFTPYVGLARARSITPAAAMPNWGADLAPLAPLLGADAVGQTQLLGQSAATGINAFRTDQNTRTLGVRWDMDASTSLKLQWDSVVVRPNGGVLWGGSPQGGRATVWSLALDFLF